MLVSSGGIIETTQGYVYWEPRPDDGGYVEIHNLYVLPEFRNQGYARTMLNSAILLIRRQYPGSRIGVFVESKDLSVNLERLTKFYSSLGLEVMNQERETK